MFASPHSPTANNPLPSRRAPKVTVTRGRVSLCQKGVTPWLMFLVNSLLVRKQGKTSRGASFEPSLAPPCGRSWWDSHRGGAGGRSDG
jgi:hypothetical protein